MKGIITTIQRLSIHDGPGIRSTVFLKGCNFRCEWCHNPETWSTKPQIQQISEKCIKCGSCIDVCHNNAIKIIEGKIRINNNLCNGCGECSKTCFAGSLRLVGMEIDTKDLIKEIIKDRPFFEESKGGVTISGGEPFMQFNFLKELVQGCKSENLHTAIETNLSVKEDKIKALIPYVDLWMVDLKSADNKAHRAHTLADNTQIISNLKVLQENKANILVRTPVIPNFNDTEQYITDICNILKEIGIKNYELLPFHSLGFDKFSQFGIENPMLGTNELDKELFNKLRTITLQVE